MTLIHASRRLYGRLIDLLNHMHSPFLLFVRLYWGWQFWQSGWGKLQDISKPIGFFTDLGIPFPVFNAWFVAFLECFGGILLFLGLASRLISIPLAFDMLVAYIAADREALKSFVSEPGKFYAADPYTFLFAALLVMVLGPGVFSLDYVVARYVEKCHGPNPVPAPATVSQKL
ncbi:MAG TPA: DoxX family protein [Terriglobales bacterium]|jgi:putative oxidoreductase|nr:DoxX family protein [Terriglobales bacterium]